MQILNMLYYKKVWRRFLFSYLQFFFQLFMFGYLRFCSLFIHYLYKNIKMIIFQTRENWSQSRIKLTTSCGKLHSSRNISHIATLFWLWLKWNYFLSFLFIHICQRYFYATDYRFKNKINIWQKYTEIYRNYQWYNFK